VSKIEKFKDAKGLIRSHKSRTANALTNEKDKETNNGLQKHFTEN